MIYLEFVWLQNDRGYVLLSQPRLPLLAVYHMSVWIYDSCQLDKCLLCLSVFKIFCMVPTSVIWPWPIVVLTALHFGGHQLYKGCWRVAWILSFIEFCLLAFYSCLCGSMAWCTIIRLLFYLFINIFQIELIQLFEYASFMMNLFYLFKKCQLSWYDNEEKT